MENKKKVVVELGLDALFLYVQHFLFYRIRL
jgi:hypothetical protein